MFPPRPGGLRRPDRAGIRPAWPTRGLEDLQIPHEALRPDGRGASVFRSSTPPLGRKPSRVFGPFRGPQSLSAAVGMPSESVGNGDSRSPANIATPRRHPVWARHTPSGHRETTFCDCHSHGRPSTSSPPNGLHSSAWQLFSDTIPTLQSTSQKAEKTCFPWCFSGSWQPWKDICPAFLVVSHNPGVADLLVSPPFFLSSMKRRKRGKDLGRSGERIGGGFCARRVGYSRGFPWPVSRAARRFVRRGPT